MRSKRAGKIQKKSLVAIILDSYQEYCNFGYPKDPKVYVVQANKETLIKVSSLLNQGIIPGKSVDKNWGFQMQENSHLGVGEIIFGPEQVRITWDGK